MIWKMGVTEIYFNTDFNEESFTDSKKKLYDSCQFNQKEGSKNAIWMSLFSLKHLLTINFRSLFLSLFV